MGPDAANAPNTTWEQPLHEALLELQQTPKYRNANIMVLFHDFQLADRPFGQPFLRGDEPDRTVETRGEGEDESNGMLSMFEKPGHGGGKAPGLLPIGMTCSVFEPILASRSAVGIHDVAGVEASMHAFDSITCFSGVHSRTVVAYIIDDATSTA
jgi:hypothetical protein